MTPIRSINYAIWAIWGAVTLVALLNAGWVRITTFEGGGAFPMTLEFFFVPDCWWRSDVGEWRNFLEMYMVPANLVMIGIAIAVPWSRLRTATATLSLLTVYFTFAFSGEPRFACIPIADLNHNILSYGDISHLQGITLFDIISLIPRILYLALFFVAPVTWAPVGRWTRLTRGAPVNTPLTT